VAEGPRRKVVVGGRVDDLCRACKMVRPHTVMTAAEGVPLRVVCDWCGSHHNYRGAPESRLGPVASGDAPQRYEREREREREVPIMDDHRSDLEALLRRIIREEAGLTPAAPADKWRGGEMVLRPGRPGLQEKSWPIETFFNKVVMIRNRLRTLEQHVNASSLPAEDKLKLQGYVTACYGSLTSFNILFADEEDRFRGSGQS
jgi:hypothetical protein